MKKSTLAMILTLVATVAIPSIASTFVEPRPPASTMLALITPTVQTNFVLEGTVVAVGRKEITVRTIEGDVDVFVTNGTPVTFRSSRNRVRELRVGDIVRVSGRRHSRLGFKASSIEVIRGANEPQVSGAQRNAIAGEVVRIDDRAGRFRMRTDDGRVIIVDAYRTDEFRRGASALYDLQAGYRVAASGRFIDSNTFRATTLRLLRMRDEPAPGQNTEPMDTVRRPRNDNEPRGGENGEKSDRDQSWRKRDDTKHDDGVDRNQSDDRDDNGD